MAKEFNKEQEFEIFKMLFDKLLFVGVAIIVIGLYYLFLDKLFSGMIFLFSGLFLFIIFSAILVAHTENHNTKISDKKN